MSVFSEERSNLRQMRLRIEFALFYFVGPIVMAVFVPPRNLFPALLTFMVIGLILLWFTDNFKYRELFRGWRQISPLLLISTYVVTAGGGLLIVALTAPDALFEPAWSRPHMILLIATFYPFLSALPQELVFRPLFFRRYADFLPDSPWAAVHVNAAIFALAHLMYWSVTVLLLTYAGGLIFGWAYHIRHNFPLAFILHAVAGIALFSVGMGAYFYSGNVVRPF